MVVSAISSKFNEGEYSVLDAGDVFDFPNKSIVGTKSFCLTNQGRMFAHDSGGIFGEEQIKTSTNLILVSLDKNTMSLSNMASESFSVTVGLTGQSFINIYDKIPRNKFFIKFRNKTNCIYQYSDENNTEHTVINELLLENDKLKLSQGNIEFPFFRVRSIEKKGLYIEITGIFNVGDTILRRVKLFLFDDGLINRLVDKVKTHPNIFHLIGVDSAIHSTTLAANISGKQLINKKIALCFNAKHIYMIDEMKGELLTKLDRSTTKFYYNKVDQKLALEKDQSVYLLDVNQSPLEEFATNDLTNKTTSLRFKIGRLSGTLLGEKWEKEEVTLLNEGSNFKFVINKDLKILHFSMKNYKLLLDKNNLFITNNNEVALLQLHLDKLISLKNKQENNQIIGYTKNHEPYLVNQDEDGIYFKQNSSRNFKYTNEDIIDISISKYGVEDSIFSEITIKTNNDPKELIINVPNHIIKDLIHQAYYYSKRKAIEKVSAEQLFVSYSRQVNDYILYQYFGQLFAMYSRLKEIQMSDMNKDIKNAEIINSLFFSIQVLKKHFDTISIYLPSVLEREMQGIMGNQSISPTLSYKNLQRRLMSITGQINRSLNEIEGSISAVSFVLIKREDYNKLIKEKTNRDLGFSATIAGIGVATILVGPVALPALLLGGIFSTVNTYFRQEDAKKQEELRKRNEDNRLDFFVDKALDSMDHLINTLLPFFISETNHSIFQAFNHVNQENKLYLQTKEVKENLFQKISQYYTYKQLPIDESVLVKKSELVELTHTSVNRSELFIEQFQREVIGYVPKSIETATK